MSGDETNRTAQRRYLRGTRWPWKGLLGLGGSDRSRVSLVEAVPAKKSEEGMRRGCAGKMVVHEPWAEAWKGNLVRGFCKRVGVLFENVDFDSEFGFCGVTGAMDTPSARVGLRGEHGPSVGASADPGGSPSLGSQRKGQQAHTPILLILFSTESSSPHPWGPPKSGPCR